MGVTDVLLLLLLLAVLTLQLLVSWGPRRRQLSGLVYWAHCSGPRSGRVWWRRCAAAAIVMMANSASAAIAAAAAAAGRNRQCSSVRLLSHFDSGARARARGAGGGVGSSNVEVGSWLQVSEAHSSQTRLRRCYSRGRCLLVVGCVSRAHYR